MHTLRDGYTHVPLSVPTWPILFRALALSRLTFSAYGAAEALSEVVLTFRVGALFTLPAVCVQPWG